MLYDVTDLGKDCLTGIEQAITWSNADLLLIGTLATNLSWKSKYQYFPKNAFENVSNVGPFVRASTY